MSGINRFVFTPSQWQELEHQALIFKYMVSGIPIPPDLLYNIERNVLDTSLSSKLFSCPPQHIGWNCCEKGLGRKVDPEPGRCRRTDGKKWRCSKEAYPDSKYCERHMHRGKNRSRKPVEFPVSAATPNPTPPISSVTKNTTTDFNNTDYYKSNYGYWMKEGVDIEHGFFSEPCGNMRSFSGSSMADSWQLSVSNFSSSSSRKNEYGYLQLQSLADDSPKEERETQRTVHRFFDEWPPPENKDSWLDLDDRSTTKLSISIPSSTLDFPIFSSRTRNDG